MPGSDSGVFQCLPGGNHQKRKMLSHSFGEVRMNIGLNGRRIFHLSGPAAEPTGVEIRNFTYAGFPGRQSQTDFPDRIAQRADGPKACYYDLIGQWIWTTPKDGFHCTEFTKT